MGGKGSKNLSLEKWRSELKRELIFNVGKEAEFARQLKLIAKIQKTAEMWKKEAIFDGLLLGALENLCQQALSAKELPQLLIKERRLKRRKGSRQLPSADFMALIVAGLELSRGNKEVQFEIRRTLVSSSDCVGIDPSKESILYWTRNLDVLQKRALPTYIDVSFRDSEDATGWADKMKFRYSTYLARHYQKSRAPKSKVEINRLDAIHIALADWEAKIT